eukprot:ANDGO_08473.mRNA.1 Glucose-6-phosphate 1-dehydrogenase 3
MSEVSPKEAADLAAHHLSFVVLGASGDLAKRKIYPALFALYAQHLLPESFIVYGYARSSLSNADFKTKVMPFVEKMATGDPAWKDKVASFFEHCQYISGKYDSLEDVQALQKKISEAEGSDSKAKRVFYMSLPPDVFHSAAETISNSCASCNSHVVIEKPFGRSLETFRELSSMLRRANFTAWKIDHYLGKEVIQNLMGLRFANVFLDALWNRSHVRSIQIVFAETLGIEGRGAYYDNYGVIRDILQNHCMQVLSLLCMEPPVSLEPDDVRNEKVKVLRSIGALAREDLVIGQYKGRNKDGYTDDPTVPKDSITPTFAACVLKIRNRRWDGVPILIKAGKGLDEQKTQIRIQFQSVPGGLYADTNELVPNQLVINVQPNEGIRFLLMNKVPGLGHQLSVSGLDLFYKSKFNTRIPDAYERLVYNCLVGDRSNFVREDELDASWRIFDSVLTDIEKKKVKPDPYLIGSRGPSSADYLVAKHGVEWRDHDEQQL